MSDIIKISGVRGYVDENGMAWLNAEDVARGFGFTQVKSDKEYVRWETINGYLDSFGFSQQVGKDDFIPENMVYRLGFKASNEVAQGFQAKLADEILPTIRKTGSYTAKPMSTLEVMAESIRILQEQENRIKQVEQVQDKQEQRLLEIECKQETIDRHFYSITGYARHIGLRGVTNKKAQSLGRQASRLSRDRGYDIGQVHDERYGDVGTYHEDILKEVFKGLFE